MANNKSKPSKRKSRTSDPPVRPAPSAPSFVPSPSADTGMKRSSPNTKSPSPAQSETSLPPSSPLPSPSFADPVQTSTTTPTSSPPATSNSPVPQSESQDQTKQPLEDIIKQAEKIKEQGNAAFKAAKYYDAIDFYTKAIELNPLEPSYLTNRAASYISLKRFRPALDDCIIAANFRASSPSPKTLLRLARCHLALGSSSAAIAAISSVLDLEPKNSAALQLRAKVENLESHLKNFGHAKGKKDWAMARLALDKCLQTIEAEGGEIPLEWRIWKIELELSRKNLEGANSAANDALRLSPNSPETLTTRGLVLFLSGRLLQALQHAASALRFDPGHEPALKLRKRIKDVERLKDEGNTVFKQGNWDAAISKYTEAIERIGESEEEACGGHIRATLLSNRATTLLKYKDDESNTKHKEALADIDVSLTLLPTSFKALRTRARIYLRLEKYEDAVTDFSNAIQQVQTEGQANDNDVRSLRAELKKAEAALKRSKTKDYYKILGVPRECDEHDIKKGYRRESLKHHPDKGGDEEKFKLVVEAHAVLSDPQRRARYDLGEDEDGQSGSGGAGHPFGGGATHMDFADLFSQFQGGGGGGFGGHMGGMGGGGPFGFGGMGGAGMGGGHPHGAGGSRRGHSHGGFGL